MSNLKTVKLYGDLGKKYGREFHLDVKSPAEAVRLLCANFKGFRQFFIGKDGKKQYHIVLNKQDLALEEAFYPSSTKEVIKIIPVVQGSGGNPFVRIIIGAVLVYTGLASNVGWALIIGGVSEIMFPIPSPVSPAELEDPENKPSYNFDGPVNTIRQGNPVPVGYGKLRVGSQVVSAGFFSEGLK